MERDLHVPVWGRGLGGGQESSERLLVHLGAGGRVGKYSCQIWVTSTNPGLPVAICGRNICFLSTLMALQKGKVLGKETLKLVKSLCCCPAVLLNFRSFESGGNVAQVS